MQSHRLARIPVSLVGHTVAAIRKFTAPNYRWLTLDSLLDFERTQMLDPSQFEIRAIQSQVVPVETWN